jgi:AraC-like DNA-binding protein
VNPLLTIDAYQEVPPSALLRDWVECFWTRGAPGATAAVHRVLPDGCTDIVLGFSASRQGALAAADVVGTMTRPLVVSSHEHGAYIGVRFRPGCALAAFGVPASELTDERVDILALWSDARPALEALHEANDTPSRVQVLEAMLVRRLASRLPAPREVIEAVHRIASVHGNLSIAALGPALGVTRQHLARRFASCVGVSPKSFARILRARRALAHAKNDRVSVDWAEIALRAGYYDQSHLVGDVRALTGLTPGQWTSPGT